MRNNNNLADTGVDTTGLANDSGLATATACGPRAFTGASEAVAVGNRSEARRSVRAAVELAEPGGWLRPFLDEGEAIGSLIIEAYGSGPILDNPVDRFAAKLVRSLKGNPQINEDDGAEFGPSGGLSLREIEIKAITLALELADNRIVRAAELLGITRHALRRKIDKFGVVQNESANLDPDGSI